MQKFKFIVTIISNLILVFLFLSGLLIAFSLLPIKGNYKLLSVMSGSMEPKIKTGSLIAVKPMPFQDYKVGDIITFQPEILKTTKDNTTHRIVGIEEKEGTFFFRTKGDANDTVDQKLVAPHQIVGKVYLAIPLLGYLLVYIKTLPGLIFLIFVPAIIIIAEELNNIRLEIKKIIRARRKKKLNLPKVLSITEFISKLKLSFQKREQNEK